VDQLVARADEYRADGSGAAVPPLRPLRAVRQDFELNKTELDEKILTKHLGVEFGRKGVEDYVKEAADAAKTLRSLRELVEKVAATNWLFAVEGVVQVGASLSG
jgi:hypothetical protein